MSRDQIFSLLILVACFLGCASGIQSQCYDLKLSEEYAEAYAFPKQCMTALHDQRGRAFLYTANLTHGLTIYDIELAGLAEVMNIPTSDMDDLAVTSIWQEGDYLYAALGDHFSDNENSGMAIIDVSDPQLATVKDVWKRSSANGGAGIVRVSGNHAFLGAMQHGLVILDITNKSDIQFVSEFVPDVNYPESNPDPAKYNARGMDIRDELVYLCYDAGGVRIIDVSDVNNPSEKGRYSLPALNGLPRAYNNCVVSGNYLYVAIDYCGMEILDVSDPASVTQVAWWNEWNCETAENNWFNSPGHTNEISYLPDCNIIGMSAGKSEAVFVDVGDPQNPFLCSTFGNTSNSQGTWGISVYEDVFYLGYIFVPLGIPFFSNYGGVKAVSVDHSCALSVGDLKQSSHLTTFYDPTLDHLVVNTGDIKTPEIIISVHDMLGRQLIRQALDEGRTIGLNRTVSGPVVVTAEWGGIMEHHWVAIP
ncbi:MAG: hypothetical protein R2813_09670 [Flavobacteriales bacterium]